MLIRIRWKRYFRLFGSSALIVSLARCGGDDASAVDVIGADAGLGDAASQPGVDASSDDGSLPDAGQNGRMPLQGLDTLDVNRRKALGVHVHDVDSMSRKIAAVPFHGKLYFAGSDRAHGIELWVSDGTVENTKLAVDIAPGTFDSQPVGLTVQGDALYFAAADASGGWGLYKSDGTSQGTLRLAALPDRKGPSSIDRVFAAGERICLFYSGATGFQCTDAAKTSLSPVSSAVRPDSRAQAISAQTYALFQTADSGLGRTDGTATGTVSPPVFAPAISSALVMGNTVVLRGTATLGGAYGVWFTDGTVAGTRRVDAIPTQTTSPYETFVRLGSSVLALFGNSLYVIDPVTLSVTTVSQAPALSSPSLLPLTDSRALLLNHDDIWVIEGQPATATKLTSFASTQTNGLDAWTNALGVAFFWDGATLWRSDGTDGGTRALGLMPSVRFSRERTPVATGSDWFFFPCEDDRTWPTACAMKVGDGTSTVIPVEDRTASSNPDTFYPLPEGGAIFTANASHSLAKPQTWFTDGTSDGTSMISTGIWISRPAKVGAKIFFLQRTPTLDCEIAAWQSGSKEATTIQKLNPSYRHCASPEMASVGGNIFFSDNLGEVFMSDGTPSGARSLSVGPAQSKARWFVRDDALYIPTANGLQRINAAGELVATLGTGRIDVVDGSDGYLIFGGQELFVSDGTVQGTTQVSPRISPSAIVVAGPRRAFVRSGTTVSRIDGATATSIAIQEVREMVAFRDGVAMTTLNHGTNVVFGDSNTATQVSRHTMAAMSVYKDRLYLTVDRLAESDPVYADVYQALWISDGTAAGTYPLGDIYPRRTSSEIKWLGMVNGASFLAGDTEAYGREVLRFAP